MLAPVIGGQPGPAVNASGEVGVLLAPVIGGRPTEDRVKANRKRSAAERCVDSWTISGDQGRWVRSHRTPRRSLFTPHRVSGGPTAEDKIEKGRITRGTFVRSGRTFVIEDDYSVEHDAHRMLEGAWTGTTEFRGVKDNEKLEEGLVSREAATHTVKPWGVRTT